MSGVPQEGQLAGIRHSGPRPRSVSSMRSMTWGITSPARWTRTRSPSRTSFLATSSRLCSVARATVTPPSSIGSMMATGVTTPRPSDGGEDREDAGDLLARRELVGEGPGADGARSSPPSPGHKIVQLDHHAVDLVAKVVPLRFDLRVVGEDLVQRRPLADSLVDLEPPRTQRSEDFPLRVDA